MPILINQSSTAKLLFIGTLVAASSLTLFVCKTCNSIYFKSYGYTVVKNMSCV
jgi:hypothetical protein